MGFYFCPFHSYLWFGFTETQRCSVVLHTSPGAAEADTADPDWIGHNTAPNLARLVFSSCIFDETRSKNSRPMNCYTTFTPRIIHSASFAWERKGVCHYQKNSILKFCHSVAADNWVGEKRGQQLLSLRCQGTPVRKFHFKDHSSALGEGGYSADALVSYSPQQVCDNGQHPAGPGCDRNGTCWRCQIAGEADTQK